MSNCVFAGTFDPFTKGHLDVIQRLSKMFDTVYVVVSKNASKNTFADGKQRYEMVKDCVSFDNVHVELYQGLLVDFCNQKGVDCIVKGVRNAVDFDYERLQSSVNKELGNIETLFMPCSDNMGFLSSSFVRELLALGKDVCAYVPEQIAKKISELYSKK